MDRICAPRRAPFGANPEVGPTGLATQQRILAAANEVIGELGYIRTSVEAITERAGCSRPTFYQYFSGKEDLHRHLATRFGDELAELITGLDPITPDREGRDALRTWLRRMATTYDRHRAVADSFAVAVRTDDRMVTGAAALSARYRATFVEAIDPDDVVHGADPDVLSAAVNVLAYGAIVHREHVGRVADERLADALADLTHRCFFGALPGVNLGARRPPRLTRAPRLSVQRDAAHRRARGVRTRERLLDAAARTFAILGYDATRVDDIAEEAGLSRGTFYRYFDDKEAALAPHRVAAVDDILSEVARLPTGDTRAWAASYLGCYQRHQAVLSVWLEATAAGAGVARRARASVAVALGQRLATRPFGDVDAEVIAGFALLEGLPAADLDGYARRIDDPGVVDTGYGTPPIVDMGAYEFDPARPLFSDGFECGGCGGWSRAVGEVL